MIVNIRTLEESENI